MSTKLRAIIGMRIRKIRKELGFSQKELANMINIHRNTLSKIECGKYNARFDIYEKIAIALKISLAELVK